ncbi:hypothetical protein M1555_04370 [Patescibacteria group bacterium]|nr:hypothetical protein [Patescibacteria group bacterium]
MTGVWDYREKDLRKSKKGRILLLERLINYGPGKKKLNRREIKSHWRALRLFPKKKRLLELLLWPDRYSPQIKH